MKFRFSSGITLAFGEYEPTLKLHPFSDAAGTQRVASQCALSRSPT